MDSNRVWFMAHWLKVEPKQSTLFFNIIILFSTLEEVEHAIETPDDEGIVVSRPASQNTEYRYVMMASRYSRRVKSLP